MRSPYDFIYRIRRIIGSVFNLAVWRIIFNPPNLNNAVSGLYLLHLLTATAFRQIKVTPTTIFDRFAKYLTRQLFSVYGRSLLFIATAMNDDSFKSHYNVRESAIN